MNPHLGRALLVVALGLPLCVFPPTARAQSDPTERAFTIAKTDDLILRVDFSTAVATVINSKSDQLARKKLESVYANPVGNNVQLIVSDNEDGKIFRYDNAAAGTNLNGMVISQALPRPGALTLDSLGNIYVVNSALGSSAARKRQLWIIRNGGPTHKVDEPPSDFLSEVEFINFDVPDPGDDDDEPSQGDLLVLSQQNPAAVYLYRSAAACAANPDCGSLVREMFIDLSGITPNGMTFAPNGKLWISTESGTIRQYHLDSGEFDTTFLSGLGSARIEMAVGVQDSCNFLMVVNDKLKNVKRFSLSPGNPDCGPLQPPDVVSNGFKKAPIGVALASSGVTTLMGSGVEVSPSAGLMALFQNVGTDGITTSRTVELVDPRTLLYGVEEESSATQFVPSSTCGLVPLGTNELCLSALDSTLPDIVIPSYVLALRKGHPLTGTPTFIVQVLDSTAVWSDIATVTIDEDDLGFVDFFCQDTDVTMQPRLFFAPETASSGSPKAELGIVEGDRFTDVSAACASHKGDSWSFSLFLTGRDTRAIDGDGGILEDKLTNLDAALDSVDVCIPQPTLGRLESRLDNAISSFGSEGEDRLCDTFCAMSAFDDLAASVPNAPCGSEVRGQLKARTNSIFFMLGKEGIDEESCVCGIVTVDPKETYLHTNPADAGALPAVPIPLASIGLQPGDTVVIEELGDAQQSTFPNDTATDYMAGVFSSSSTLLASSFLDRVDDAIEAGDDFATPNTQTGNEPTNITQDFKIPSSGMGGVEIVIPAGATHLFVTHVDVSFGDNSDPDNDYAVRIRKVVP